MYWALGQCGVILKGFRVLSDFLLISTLGIAVSIPQEEKTFISGILQHVTNKARIQTQVPGTKAWLPCRDVPGISYLTGWYIHIYMAFRFSTKLISHFLPLLHSWNLTKGMLHDAPSCTLTIVAEWVDYCNEGQEDLVFIKYTSRNQMCDIITEIMHYSSQSSCRYEVLTSNGESRNHIVTLSRW